MKQSTYLEYQKQLQKHKTVRYFWQFWSNYSFFFFLVAGLLMFIDPQMRDAAPVVGVLGILALLISRGIIVTAINIIYERRRPYQVLEFKPITSRFFSEMTTFPNSFPSRHATSYFAVATAVCLFFPALGACLVAVSLMAGVARVIMGYHWPTDIIAGAILGTLVGYFTVAIGYSILFTRL